MCSVTSRYEATLETKTFIQRSSSIAHTSACVKENFKRADSHRASSNLWLISCLDFLAVYFYTSWALKSIYCNVRKAMVNIKLSSNKYIHPTELLGLTAPVWHGPGRVTMFY